MKRSRAIEPDFVIQSKPLTKEEEQALSEFIIAYKPKHKDKPGIKKRTVGQAKAKVQQGK